MESQHVMGLAKWDAHTSNCHADLLGKGSEAHEAQAYQCLRKHSIMFIF